MLLLVLLVQEGGCGWSRRTSLDLTADVSRLSEASGPSHDNEQRVFVERRAVEVCGRGAPRLLPDLPLRHPAGRHVGNLQWDVMSSDLF